MTNRDNHYFRLGILRDFRVSEGGATAVEYGLLISGISIAILATVFLIGGSLEDIFTKVSDFF